MKVPANVPRPRIGRRSLIITGSVIVLLIILGSTATVYTDLLWFKETKFETVFYQQLWTKSMLGLTFGAVFAAVLLVNLWVVQKLTARTGFSRCRIRCSSATGQRSSRTCGSA